MSTDYIPGADDAFKAWLDNFVTQASAMHTALGLTTSQITDLQADQGSFESALTNLVTKRNDYHSGVSTKKVNRSAVEENVRMLVRQIQGNAAVEVSMKEMLGINPHDGTRTYPAPTQPTDLVVTPDGNGVNALKWNPNGNIAGTTYVIEAITGTGTNFAFVKNTTKTKFDHRGQKPGQTMTYRVTATRADEESIPSAPSVIYPTATGQAQNSPTLELSKAA